MVFSRSIKGLLWAAVAVLLSHCQNHTTVSGPYVYVASGTTYAGSAVLMSSPSNTIAKYNTDGSFNSLLADYTSTVGDSPTAMLDYDSNHLLVAVNNASGSRLELVAKDGSGRSTFIVSAAGLVANLKGLAYSGDGGILVAHSSAIDKFNDAHSRVTNNSISYISAPAAPCATATTNITSVALGPNNSIFFTHGGANPNNLIDVIDSEGYLTSADCVAATPGPTANHIPTTSMMHSSGYYLVAFGSTTGPTQEIYSYTVTSTSIGSATLAAQNSNSISGVSAMAEMSDGSVLIANADAAFNTVEHFTFDSSTQTMTHINSVPFITPSLYTKSISSLVVAQ